MHDTKSVPRRRINLVYGKEAFPDCTDFLLKYLREGVSKKFTLEGKKNIRGQWSILKTVRSKKDLGMLTNAKTWESRP